MKKLLIVFFITSVLGFIGCDALDALDDMTVAEPCEKQLRTNIPDFTTQDLLPCSDIESLILSENNTNVDSRHLNYDLKTSNFIHRAYLLISEYTTCADANQLYDLNRASQNNSEDYNIETSSSISNLFDEAVVVYISSTGNIYEIIGRIDNTVLRFGLPPACRDNSDSAIAIEIFNNIGLRVIN